ncbi:hypothetical protein BCR34DRAFT_491122 [Clohesyomyces aquaticus]|uniref:N-acetyltransferase domain-containing protein n=1 Tax=Clohesyomyces aquaticus TaxID=1231657 RepID=A0A1Y1Z578_9PLEO|nr:hypothetical protein BCR34DRAFT_491122 [Clohesyomyces aquaticus]
MAAPKEWHLTVSSQTFLISTSRTLLNESFIQECFASEEMYWAKATSVQDMSLMLDNSLTLGLYKLQNPPPSQSPSQSSEKREFIPIGLARLITDYVTLAYLTDVFIVPSYRNLGLARWLVDCVKETVMQIPELRRCILLTGTEKLQRMYEKEMGMSVMQPERKTQGGEGEGHVLVAMGATKEDMRNAGKGTRGE